MAIQNGPSNTTNQIRTCHVCTCVYKDFSCKEKVWAHLYPQSVLLYRRIAVLRCRCIVVSLHRCVVVSLYPCKLVSLFRCVCVCVCVWTLVDKGKRHEHKSIRRVMRARFDKKKTGQPSKDTTTDRPLQWKNPPFKWSAACTSSTVLLVHTSYSCLYWYY